VLALRAFSVKMFLAECRKYMAFEVNVKFKVQRGINKNAQKFYSR
jgi:hypothetical protein